LYNIIEVLNFHIDNPDRINFYFARNKLKASLCNQLYRTEHTVKCVDGVVTEESAINVHIRVTFVIFVLDSLFLYLTASNIPTINNFISEQTTLY